MRIQSAKVYLMFAELENIIDELFESKKAIKKTSTQTRYLERFTLELMFTFMKSTELERPRHL